MAEREAIFAWPLFLLRCLYVDSISSRSMTSKLHISLILTTCLAVPLRSSPGCYYCRNSSTYNITGSQFSSGLHVDRRCLPSRQRNIRTDLGQALRHLGPQAYRISSTCHVFRQLSSMCYCENHGNSDYRPSISRSGRRRTHLAGARLCQRLVQLETEELANGIYRGHLGPCRRCWT